MSFFFLFQGLLPVDSAAEAFVEELLNMPSVSQTSYQEPPGHEDGNVMDVLQELLDESQLPFAQEHPAWVNHGTELARKHRFLLFPVHRVLMSKH